MASVKTEGDALIVQLSPLEKVGALHGDLREQLSRVKRVWVTDAPWRELRGMRAPGTGIPRVIMLGTTRGSFGKDFCAVYGRAPALVVELEGSAFRRWILTVPEPQALVSALSPQSA